MSTPAPNAPQSTTAARPWWHCRLRILILIGIGYAVLMLVLLSLEDYFVFRPTTAEHLWIEPTQVGLTVEDVYLSGADGTVLHAWWCPLKEDRGDWTKGAILFCHGNGGNLSERVEFIQEWQRQMRLPVLIFDYPGFGHSQGKPSEQGCYKSADAAYNWLTQTKRVPPEKIVLFGESLGSGVVIDLALRQPHRAVVLMSAFTSVPDVAQAYFPFLPGRWLVRTQFNNLEKIGSCPRPIFIAHCECDGIIPCSQARQLFNRAKEPKQFHSLAGEYHINYFSADFYAAVRQFLDENASSR